MSSHYDPRRRDPSVSRRPQNRQEEAWIEALLLRGRIGRVATLWQGEDGQAFPFITPLAYAYRPQEHDIVYHTNIVGRLRANTVQGHPATFEVSETGSFLPSNSPLELTVQYRSVIAFGTARLLTDPAQMRAALSVLCVRAFPDLRPGQEMRPILDSDLARTSVYSLAVERWSGKENWTETALQDESWPPLSPDQARPRPSTPSQSSADATVAP
ncbi:NimA [Deinococcus malanensis]|uniref:NimA n=1 Tax=Deinococcus malanensis TaxID=1706855 RepID=A0ABQ2ERN5_9DEIO|nr:pyridoxamine 5'-phosphate oxidase family protein [Deinococcus malanensis]GGK23153.1 NimA [Deinococcus malanensis]